jgi:hypothetical protein
MDFGVDDEDVEGGWERIDEDERDDRINNAKREDGGKRILYTLLLSAPFHHCQHS